MPKIKRNFIIFLAFIFIFSNSLIFNPRVAKARVLPQACHQLKFSGNGLVSQTLTEQGSPYCIDDAVTLPESETLIIEAGAVIKFNEPYQGQWYMFGASLNLQGKVYIQGTLEKPVIFTSIKDDSVMGDTNGDGNLTLPAPGDWDSVEFNKATEKIIEYAIFKYGGFDGRMLKVNNGKNLSITNSEVTLSAGDGIHSSYNFNRFENNKIYNNKGAGIVNTSFFNKIDIRNNWWGSDQGPYVEGKNENSDSKAEKIYGTYLKDAFFYQPWLRMSDRYWRKDIQPGDILYDPYTSGVGHIGLYIGNNKTIEANASPEHPFDLKYSRVKENSITIWDYPHRKNVYLLRVKKPKGLSDQAMQIIRNRAIQFAENQKGEPYDWGWYGKDWNSDASSWYCSELVWAAYFNQGIDLEYSHDPLGIVSPVSPAEIFLDEDTYVVNSHIEYKGGWRDYVFLMILSPVQVTVTDPNGNKVTKGDINIPGATYLEDYLDPETGKIYDMISLPNITGEYRVDVKPKPGVEASETYSLVVKVGNDETVLAQDVRVDDIPDEPYIIQGSLGAGNDGFKDTETSSQNSFLAATLNFSLSTTTLGNLNLNTYKTFNLINLGNLDFKYSLESQVSGDMDFCQDLNLLIYENDELKYNGKLANLSTVKIISGSQDEWKFILDDPAQNYTGKNCNFSFIFKAWQIGLDYSHGFTDTETLSGSVASAAPKPKVVINEVYYDVDANHGSQANNENEWVEIYNADGNPVDISGWQICDNYDCDIIPAINPIPAQGYAVITKATTTWSFWPIATSTLQIVLNDKIGNGLAENDRLTLKDNAGVEIDAMSYGGDTYAFSPSRDGVPKGHSLARSPAGKDTDTKDDFVDLSIPTPGGP